MSWRRRKASGGDTKRIGELDTIFQRIYEDNIIGKLLTSVLWKMSKGYEDEQHTLQTEANEIQSELQQEEKEKRGCKTLPAIVKKYTDLTELTPEIPQEFIDKIIVHALIRAAETVTGNRDHL